jgi:PAS domain S-box-containing protein
VRGALLRRECSVLDDCVDAVSKKRIGQLEEEFEKRTRQLRESQIKYKEIVENSNDIIAVVQDGKLKFVNTKVFELTGYKEEEILDTPFSNFIFPEDLAVIEQRYRNRLEGKGHAGTYPFRLLRKDGEAFWVEENSKRTLWEGEPAVLAFVTDITERKKAEDALKESERKYRQLVQSANSIIIYFDSQGRITFLNKFGQDFFGYAEEEIIGQNIIETIVPEKDSQGRDLYDLVGDIIKHPDRHAYNENENVRKNGERVWIAWTNRTVIDSEGHPIMPLSRKRWMPKSCSKFKRIKISDFLDIARH